MSEWKKYRLGDLVITNRKSIDKDFPYTNILYLDTGSITTNAITELQKFELNKAPSRAKRIVCDEDIIYSTVRPNQLHYGFIQNPQNNLIVSTGFATITCKKDKIHPKFLYYHLSQTQITEYLHIIAESSTSTYPSIKPSDIEALEIFAPSLPTQTQIAQILTSFDDKIELLGQMNQTLETIAQTIFKEWFVDFNFPGFDGELINGLPKGWRMGKLGEEFDLVMGQSPKGETYNQDGNGMVFYQGRTDFGFRFPTNRLFTTEPNRKANTLDTLVSVRAPVGDINMANEPCCIGRGLSSVRHKTKAFSYTYYLMKSIENIFKGFESEGTVFGSINKSNFEDIEILVPELKSVQEFEITVNAIDYKILENANQIQTLTHLRDTLLPKLMSGAVAVE